jgi:hypothetical protein
LQGKHARFEAPEEGFWLLNVSSAVEEDGPVSRLEMPILLALGAIACIQCGAAGYGDLGAV